MATSNVQRQILTGIAFGIVAGVVIGLVGAYFNLPMGVRGGLIGALVVVGMQYMRKQQNKGSQA
jgi:hypothetical protein